MLIAFDFNGTEIGAHHITMHACFCTDLENGKFAEACGGLGTSRDIQRKSATNAQIDGVPVDENLFMEEDFDGLEEELEELDVED